MEIVQKEELRFRAAELAEKILNGAVFIYPTDTIYGIGCDARNPDAVKKIRLIKQRPDSPFSVIAPSIEWIHDNCVINKEAEQWIDKLPGALTLIMNKKSDSLAKEIAPNLDSVGVRVPMHWFTRFVQQLGIPIVTTSVNVTDQPFMTSLDDLDDDIRHKVSFCIYEGEKQGRPSKIARLTGNNPEINER